MQVLEAAVAETANPWALRRNRAAELATRYPHAAEMLRLYQALLPVQEQAYVDARDSVFPRPRGQGQGRGNEIAEFAAKRVIPSVIDATVSSGPTGLRDGVIKVFCTADLTDVVRKWLDQEPLNPFETYLARASTSPVFEAVSSDTPSPTLPTRGREIPEGQCRRCGGLPQLSYFSFTGEALLTGPRYLVCSRCAHNWVFARMTCASCGETDGNKLPIYQEQEQFPHARVDGCRTCKRYLLTFDLRRDDRAVPIVDELAALPLDLFARDQGLTKITPNLMGN
jgi:hypothetical protein